MGHALLWLQHLLFCGCLIVVGLSGFRRGRGLLARWGWLLLGLAPATGWALLAGLIVASEEQAQLDTGLRWPSLGQAIPLVLLTLVMAVRQWRGKRAVEGAWSPGWPLVGAAALLLLQLGTYWQLDHAIHRQLADIRREAANLALANAPPRVADSQNAALVYQRAYLASSFQRAPEARQQWLEVLSDPQRELEIDDELREYVRRREPIRQLLSRGAGLPLCVFDRDWGRPSLSMLLPEMAQLRDCARDLRLAARVQATDGQLAEACQQLLTIRGIAEHLRQEPILISMLVSLAVDHVVFDEVQHLVAHQTLDAAALDVLASLPHVPITPRLQRALLVEESVGLMTMTQVDLMTLTALSGSTSSEVDARLGWMARPDGMSLYRVLITPRDLAAYRSVMLEYRLALNAEGTGQLDNFESLEKNLQKTWRRIPPVTRLLVPTLSAAHTRTVEGDTRQAILYVAVAALQYQLAHQRLPTSLEQLADDQGIYIPTDPFSGEPLRLRSDGEQMLIYSVGANRRDDGGVARDAESEDQTAWDDVVFRIRERP